MINILDETIAFYGEDTSRRAMNNYGSCMYKTEDGKQCALGRKMLPDINFTSIEGQSASSLNTRMINEDKNLDDLLQEDCRDLPVGFWQRLQEIHDNHDIWTEEGINDEGTHLIERIRRSIIDETINNIL